MNSQNFYVIIRILTNKYICMSNVVIDVNINIVHKVFSLVI